MRRFVFLPLLAVFLLGWAAPVHAEPAFGSNCLSCHSELQTNTIVVFNEDTLADPDESATGAPDRGVLPVFLASRGQVKTLQVQVEDLSADDTYAVQLSRLRYSGVEGGGTLVYSGDCDWPQWGDSAPYYTDPVVRYQWGTGPTTFAFTIYVDPSATPDYYDLMFAVAGMFDADGGLFYARQHFYLQVMPTLIGDIDGDGDVDYADSSLFVPILLGMDQSRTDLCDMNGDSVVDGKDIQLFIDALMAGQ
ncbi:MAG TPA: dockerin type I domain-containing protein [Phycisphaerae bacterium]|nr:dockerin type I domain-containing protein [Phycisphaerae bacterium]